ncbi:hypothetical protein VA7868_00465 [Vibrio aerogenes CECT 7868]|uniref:Uncharacterized protein n=1 Tax=Vibrio aerogenes CECT 7868 TaxID=1216006 RepID=A0A1M5VNS3_9VIBR|nr:hypothetical protein [Vibrio aerogenes]SHH76885.1 hypothetical protein VA7868_00465 [Vibrio aerogenes CECT 7868]
MFYLMPFQQDWSKVITSMKHWFDFQQQSLKEVTDFMAAMSPQKDMAQMMAELKAAHAGQNVYAGMNFWLHPEKSHQAVMELFEIFQAVDQRLRTSQNHAAKVCLENASGTSVLLHQHSNSPKLLADLIEHQLDTAKSLKGDQGEMIGALSALQVALKAWTYRQIAQEEESTTTEAVAE